MATGNFTRTKLKYMIRVAATASDRRARQLYDELYGAVPSDSIPVERVRESIIEGAKELLGED